MTPEVSLRVTLPKGAVAEPDSALPTLDLSSVAGASLRLRRGFQGEDGAGLRAICASAPSDRWAPGVEELVLGRVNAVTEGALRGAVQSFEAFEIEHPGMLFEQRFEATALLSSGARVAARGRHMLGFAGEAPSALLCSVVCVEPALPPGSVESGRCAALVNAAAMEGALTGAPPPSALIRAILLTAEHPEAALSVAAAALLAMVSVTLARRPRPRR